MKIFLHTMFLCPDRIKRFWVNQDGLAPMVSIIIISAATLIIAVNLAYIGQGDMEASIAAQSGSEASDNANNCAEDILSRLRDGKNYASSSQTLSIGGGSCTINITEDLPHVTIEIQSIFNNYYKKISIYAEIASSGIIIYDWREY